MESEPAGRFARLAARFADGMPAPGELRPRLTAAKAVAYAIAAGVHLFTLALLAAGAATLVVYAPNLLAILLGLALLGAAAAMRPRVPRMPGGFVLEPADAPALHELAGRVAAALDRPPPDAIVVDAGWNAAWTVAGWRRRRVLVLGLPLLVALEPQQRVALIAHEIGHDRNGDLVRGLFVGSAVSGLEALSWLLRPSHGSGLNETLEWLDGRADVGRDASGRRRPVARGAPAGARHAPRGVPGRRRRCRRRRDRTRCSRCTSVRSWNRRSSSRSSGPRSRATPPAPSIVCGPRCAPSPRTSWRSGCEVARRERTRLQASHPPMALRIALLEQRAPLPPVVTFASTRIDAELAPLEREAGRILVDRYRASLH